MKYGYALMVLSTIAISLMTSISVSAAPAPTPPVVNCTLLEVDVNRTPNHTTKVIPIGSSVTGDWYPDVKATVQQKTNGAFQIDLLSATRNYVYTRGFGKLNAGVTARLERDDESKWVDVLCVDFSRKSVPVTETPPATPVTIKPLATVCNMTPQYQNVDMGEYTYDDSLGGFPNDRMTELCRSRGATSYRNTSVKEIAPSVWGPNFRKRIFTYKCIGRQPIPIDTCNVITQCKLGNVIAENIASIEHWMENYKCAP